MVIHPIVMYLNKEEYQMVILLFGVVELGEILDKWNSY
jgi:hypothetical protein